MSVEDVLECFSLPSDFPGELLQFGAGFLIFLHVAKILHPLCTEDQKEYREFQRNEKNAFIFA